MCEHIPTKPKEKERRKKGRKERYRSLDAMGQLFHHIITI
jgi:hypothetical protein